MEAKTLRAEEPAATQPPDLTAGGGVLRQTRRRAGQTANVELNLKLLGAHGDTAPHDCPKSGAIFEQGRRLIAGAWTQSHDENDNYTGWDLTGAYLLSYGLPLKSLRVTGSKDCAAPPLDTAEVAEVASRHSAWSRAAIAAAVSEAARPDE